MTRDGINAPATRVECDGCRRVVVVGPDRAVLSPDAGWRCIEVHWPDLPPGERRQFDVCSAPCAMVVAARVAMIGWTGS